MMQEEEEEEEYDYAAEAEADADADESPKKLFAGNVDPRWEEAMKWTSSWEDMLIWWSIARGTRTPEAIYATHRVYMIGAIFKNRCQRVSSKRLEELFNELPGYVDLVDIAKELHSIDALDYIVGVVDSTNVDTRLNAVKLINNMAKKSHISHQLLMEEGRKKGIVYLAYFAEHDPIVESAALDTISSLLSDDERGIYAGLIYQLQNESVDRQRKALNLIARLVKEHNFHYNIVTASEYPSIMMCLMCLTSSVDAEVQKAAFECLTVLVKVENSGNSGQVVKNDKLKHVLQECINAINAINAMAPEDLGPAREEIQVLVSLWNAYYNEYSSLRENGLPGEYTPASDVAQAICCCGSCR